MKEILPHIAEHLPAINTNVQMNRNAGEFMTTQQSILHGEMILEDEKRRFHASEKEREIYLKSLKDKFITLRFIYVGTILTSLAVSIFMLFWMYKILTEVFKVVHG